MKYHTNIFLFGILIFIQATSAKDLSKEEEKQLIDKFNNFDKNHNIKTPDSNNLYITNISNTKMKDIETALDTNIKTFAESKPDPESLDTKLWQDIFKSHEKTIVDLVKNALDAYLKDLNEINDFIKTLPKVAKTNTLSEDIEKVLEDYEALKIDKHYLDILHLNDLNLFISKLSFKEKFTKESLTEVEIKEVRIKMIDIYFELLKNMISKLMKENVLTLYRAVSILTKTSWPVWPFILLLVMFVVVAIVVVFIITYRVKNKK